MDPVYTEFDYLAGQSFLLADIGTVLCPRLRDIRAVTCNVFRIYQNILSIPFSGYLKMMNLEERYQSLSSEEKEKNTLFYLLLFGNSSLLEGILRFFLKDSWEFDQPTASYRIFQWREDGTKKIVGHLGNHNFEAFRTQMQWILGMKKQEDSKPKFKNKLAENLYHKLQDTPRSKEPDDAYTLDNMVCKYCTHNKVGINILNVWDMTYYQFIRLFAEYTHGRQHDFNDLMAAHTFTYKNSSDYHPLDYIKATR